MGATGCVGYMFNLKGIFAISPEAEADEDTVMMAALEAGAEDVKAEEGGFEVITTPEAFDDVEKALADAGIEVEVAELTMVPDTYTELAGEDAEKFQKMLDALDELDDVQDVYHSADMPEEEE